MPEQERQPRTPLGRTLTAIRKRIVASGQRLLGWSELDDEVAERRGERVPVCTNCETNDATIFGGVQLCDDCAEDNPDLLKPVIEARKRERDFQEWKDERHGV